MSQPPFRRIEERDVTRREFYQALGIFTISLPRGERCGPPVAEDTTRFVPVADETFRRNLELFTRDLCQVGPVLADIPLDVRADLASGKVYRYIDTRGPYPW